MKLAVIITIRGSIDIIMGEVDCRNDILYNKSTSYQLFFHIENLKRGPWNY
ncbi:hypothetical protein OIU78_011915, partial [Salix suchowensis]